MPEAIRITSVPNIILSFLDHARGNADVIHYFNPIELCRIFKHSETTLSLTSPQIDYAVNRFIATLGKEPSQETGIKALSEFVEYAVQHGQGVKHKDIPEIQATLRQFGSKITLELAEVPKVYLAGNPKGTLEGSSRSVKFAKVGLVSAGAIQCMRSYFHFTNKDEQDQTSPGAGLFDLITGIGMGVGGLFLKGGKIK